MAKAIFEGRMDAAQVTKHLQQEYARRRCDGLFLPLVDHRGVKLPVQQIVSSIRSGGDLRFVVVDGAQAINHVPLELAKDYCDILVAGCHKWLRSFTPLGVAFYGRKATAEPTRRSLLQWLRQGKIDDPLLRFVRELESLPASRYGETVSVSPLLAANAAVVDALNTADSRPAAEENRLTLRQIAEESGWLAPAVAPDLASRIVLLRPPFGGHPPADELRRRFHAYGIALTSYPNGSIRISLPDSPLTDSEHRWLSEAFTCVVQPPCVTDAR